MMLSNLEQDVATSVAILDRLPAAERAAWLPRLERRTYRYRLDQGLAGEAMPSSDPPMAAASIVKAIGSDYRLTFLEIPGPNAHFQAHLNLADGAPLTIDVTPAPVPVARWLPVVLLIQLAVLLLCTWLAVRLAIGPLTRLAQAVDNLDPDQPACNWMKAAHVRCVTLPWPSTPCRRALLPTSRNACSCWQPFPTTCKHRSLA